MTHRFGRFAATLTLILGLYLASAVPAAAQTVYGIKFTVSSQPGTTTVRNIDVAGSLPTTKIKRYTVSIGPMKTVPTGGRSGLYPRGRPDRYRVAVNGRLEGRRLESQQRRGGGPLRRNEFARASPARQR